MANPGYLTADTTLYSHFCPEGRTFPAGTEWPGDAWTLQKGGKPVGSDAVSQAMEDLIEAQDRIDRLTETLAAKDHDLAQATQAKDAAEAALAAQAQALLDAQKAQKDAEAIAKGLTKERDQARAEAEALRAQVPA